MTEKLPYKSANSRSLCSADLKVMCEASASIPTYCNNTIVRQPKAETEAFDRAIMREIGMKLATGYLKSPPLSNGH